MIFMLKLISLTNTHSGNSFMSLKTIFRIGHSTVGLIEKNTCKALLFIRYRLFKTTKKRRGVGSYFS